MSKATVHARIQLKNDTEKNWGKSHFVPLRGEVIIYAADDFTPFSRIKVGDGATPVIDLPFVSSGNASTSFHDSTYWYEHPTEIPKEGEIIIYSDYIEIEPGVYQPGIKIGDGTTYVADLPFIDETMQYHINNAAIHVTPEEKTFWNNKINCEDEVSDETLILNRR